MLLVQECAFHFGVKSYHREMQKMSPLTIMMFLLGNKPGIENLYRSRY